MLSMAQGMNGFRTPGKSMEPTLVESRAIAAGLMPAPVHEGSERARKRAERQAARRAHLEQYPDPKAGWTNWQRHHGGAPYPLQALPVEAAPEAA
jgi:hypothetical protein